MKLSEFNTRMPEDLIASHPAPVRDESRLMVLHKRSNEIEHRVFKEILQYFILMRPAHPVWGNLSDSFLGVFINVKTVAAS